MEENIKEELRQEKYLLSSSEYNIYKEELVKPIFDLFVKNNRIRLMTKFIEENKKDFFNFCMSELKFNGGLE